MAKASMHYLEPTNKPNGRLCGAHRMTRATGDRTRVTCGKCLAILARPEYADGFPIEGYVRDIPAFEGFKL